MPIMDIHPMEETEELQIVWLRTLLFGIETSLLQDKAKIFMAKYYCVRLHTLFGAALAAGMVAARMVTGRYGPKTFFL